MGLTIQISILDWMILPMKAIGSGQMEEVFPLTIRECSAPDFSKLARNFYFLFQKIIISALYDAKNYIIKFWNFSF